METNQQTDPNPKPTVPGGPALPDDQPVRPDPLPGEQETNPSKGDPGRYPDAPQPDQPSPGRIDIPNDPGSQPIGFIE